ncbi:hypothetical protein CIB84_013465 [Bambusicola thoracicus]|uniref:Uncharacterized protein n=1 Tax=Bambusicola thoracicus TaxID=9083 RepID=A0A2P4SF96_BAMTH|nr:hypothetical protein CIB84_013465 [Bambusicola thoracicus]
MQHFYLSLNFYISKNSSGCLHAFSRPHDPKTPSGFPSGSGPKSHKFPRCRGWRSSSHQDREDNSQLWKRGDRKDHELLGHSQQATMCRTFPSTNNTTAICCLHSFGA